jgi:hypothetical protein
MKVRFHNSSVHELINRKSLNLIKQSLIYLKIKYKIKDKCKKFKVKDQN